MKTIHYRVTLLEPTLVTSLQGDPNSGVAFDYLPGSALRGLLIGKYLGSKSVDVSDSALQRLFFDGSTRYLNGYLLDVDDQPALPVPASWQRVKGNEDEIFDFAVKVQCDRQQWQPVSGSFYTRSGEDVRLIRPARNVAVHTQRTARFGRAMPEKPLNGSGQAGQKVANLLEADEIVGAVYRYDALAAGQTFQAAIICDNDGDEPTLRNLIGGPVILGGSRSGGYGRAEINLLADNDAGWDMTDDVEDTLEDKLIVTLQSDVLLRDARGQFAVDPELLTQVLGRHLEVKLEREDAYLGAETVGGFNRKWHLPLPQALAVRMGSVLVFKDPGCNPKLLNNLEARGIGERRAEGFGRIAFNRQCSIHLVVKENMRKGRGSADFKISEAEARKLARLMVDRMVRQQLDERLLAAANGVKITNPPSNAQISRLRSIVLAEIRGAMPDTSRICRFIENGIEARGSARRQFERSILNDKKPLLGWLKGLLRCDDNGIWTMADNDWRALLSLSGVNLSTRIGDVREEIDNALRLEYVLRLIDLVLAHAAKQSGEED